MWHWGSRWGWVGDGVGDLSGFSNPNDSMSPCKRWTAADCAMLCLQIAFSSKSCYTSAHWPWCQAGLREREASWPMRHRNITKMFLAKLCLHLQHVYIKEMIWKETKDRLFSDIWDLSMFSVKVLFHKALQSLTWYALWYSSCQAKSPSTFSSLLLTWVSLRTPF